MCKKTSFMPQHIVILGAGISGLTCAWFLKKRFRSEITLTILEQSSRAGGCIQTIEQDGFLFEQGPHSLRSKGSSIETLCLIEELGLQNEVILADSSARFRYLYTQKKLQKIPSNFLSLLFSPLTRGVFPALFRDLRTPKGQLEDESIANFFERRFNSQFANQFIDPLVSGIYAGDSRTLSLKSCFPWLYQLEQKYRSILIGSFRSKKQPFRTSSFVQNLQRAPLFSFKKGMETLTQELMNQIEADICFNCSAKQLNFYQDNVEISLGNQKILNADYLISALPASSLGNLLLPTDPLISDLFFKIPYTTVAVVNLGYQNQVFNKKGFGYLVPSQEDEEILGCIWASCVFPQQSQNTEETRLTVMIGGTRHASIKNLTEQECLTIALKAVAKHLDIQALPLTVVVKIANEVIPQYEVGYACLLSAIQSRINTHFPRFRSIGSLYKGVSISDCITYAHHVSNQSF
jgi:oxygen-dependent protoporphyrinogen oxidase